MRINGNMEITTVVTSTKESKNDTSKDFNSVLNNQIKTSNNDKNTNSESNVSNKSENTQNKSQTDVTTAISKEATVNNLNDKDSKQVPNDESVDNEVLKEQDAIKKIITEEIKNNSKEQSDVLKTATDDIDNGLKELIDQSIIQDIPIGTVGKNADNVQKPLVKELSTAKTATIGSDSDKVQEVPLLETDAEKIKEAISVLDKILNKISSDKISEESTKKEDSDKSDDANLESLIYAITHVTDLLNKIDNLKLEIKDGTLTDTIIKALTEQTNELQGTLNNSDSKAKVTDILSKLIDSLSKTSTKESISKEDLTSIFKLTDVVENKIARNAKNTNTALEKGSEVSTSKTSIVTETVNVLEQLVKQIKTEVKNILESKSDNSNSNVQVNTSIKIDIKTEIKKENSSKESNTDTEKEDKVLKSILSDGDDTKISRFSLVPSKITTANVEASTSNPTISKETLAQDVIKTVKYMNTNNLKELTVKINPKELGEVLIKIVQSEGVLKATIKASTNETYSLLSQNANDIKKQLGEQNIRIESVDISLNEDTSFFKGEGSASNLFNQDERNNQHKGKVIQSGQGLIDVNLQDEMDETEILSNINMLA